MTILSDVNKAVTSLEEGIGLNREHEDSTEKQNQIPVMTEDEYLASRGYENPFLFSAHNTQGKSPDTKFIIKHKYNAKQQI